MSLSRALIKRIIEEENLDTWANLRKNYLPLEFHSIYEIINTHVDQYFKLPTFEEMKFAIRDESTLDKIALIEKEEVDAESFLLLDYLKSEFTQKELILGLDKFITESIAFSSAEEAIDGLYEVISNVETKVDLTKTKDSIEKVELFDSEEEMEASLRLGLNEEYDERFILPSTSLVLFGGFRGSGKSIVCNNIAQRQLEAGKTAIKFSMEMTLREELQRQCAIATGVPHFKIRYKELSIEEWDKIARWWASRYQDGYDIYTETYCKDKDFNRFHSLVSQKPLAQPAIDIIHSTDITLAKFKAETLKRLNKYDNVGCIILDYINKLKLNDYVNKYEWMQQVTVADELKIFAEEIGIPIVSPFQIKASGEVKFSKDILVPADAAYNIIAGEDYLEFECIKMRHMEERGFVSKMDWFTLQVGPETAIKPIQENTEAPQEL